MDNGTLNFNTCATITACNTGNSMSAVGNGGCTALITAGLTGPSLG